MKEEDAKDREFKVRSYGKSELASLYMPDISPKSAGETMRRWIEKVPGLADALAATGLQPLDRRYTPAQVRMIVDALGEP